LKLHYTGSYVGSYSPGQKSSIVIEFEGFSLCSHYYNNNNNNNNNNIVIFIVIVIVKVKFTTFIHKSKL